MTIDMIIGMLIMLAVVGLGFLCRWVLDVEEALRLQRLRDEAED